MRELGEHILKEQGGEELIMSRLLMQKCNLEHPEVSNKTKRLLDIHYARKMLEAFREDTPRGGTQIDVVYTPDRFIQAGQEVIDRKLREQRLAEG